MSCCWFEVTGNVTFCGWCGLKCDACRGRGFPGFPGAQLGAGSLRPCVRALPELRRQGRCWARRGGKGPVLFVGGGGADLWLRGRSALWRDGLAGKAVAPERAPTGSGAWESERSTVVVFALVTCGEDSVGSVVVDFAQGALRGFGED